MIRATPVMRTKPYTCSTATLSMRKTAGAVYEGVSESEEREEQLPSWNRRGGPKGRGGSKVEMALHDSNERKGRRIIRSIYHPGAARHPSCSRRGVAPPSPPIHSHLHRPRLQGQPI